MPKHGTKHCSLMPRHGLFPGQHIASSPPSLAANIGHYGGWGPLSRNKGSLRSGIDGGLGGFIRGSGQLSIRMTWKPQNWPAPSGGTSRQVRDYEVSVHHLGSAHGKITCCAL